MSANFLSFACMKDIFYPYGSVYYDHYQLNYKQTIVSRVRECNGTITETVISISYFTNYCDHYTGSPCYYGLPYSPTATSSRSQAGKATA